MENLKYFLEQFIKSDLTYYAKTLGITRISKLRKSYSTTIYA